MSRQWQEHEDAHKELRAAIFWYEEQRIGWGNKFADATEAAIESILEAEFCWGLYLDTRSDPQFYSRSIKGFPFYVVYMVLNDEVFVLAYAHERRRPGYWLDRLK
ncbi:MAG: hypothetical protein Q4G30_07890 [Actinomycetaceae bacterium]|nr:hypothetical protein [Actinomycetaceae bacterium]